MSVMQARVPMRGRTTLVLAFGLVAIALDALVSVVAFAEWRSYVGAPKTAFLAPADDFGYFIAGLAYAAASALRYLALTGLLIALLRHRPHRRGGRGESSGVGLARPWRLAAAAIVAIDVAYFASAWSLPNPSAAWCVLRIATGAASALVAILVVATILRRPTATRDERNQTAHYVMRNRI